MDSTLRDQFINIVGAKNAITDPHDQVPYLKEWRDIWRGQTPVVLRPANTAEVSAILKLAYEDRKSVV